MANQQRRRKRRTSSRITTGKTRKISIVESEDEVRQPLGDNWYYQNKIGQYYFSQSPNTQVYFAKVAFGVISGFIIGFFYFIDVVAKNWFLIPIMGVLFIGVMARRFLHIDKETITDDKKLLKQQVNNLWEQLQNNTPSKP